MNLSKFKIISQTQSISCTVISSFGIVILFILGFLYQIRAEKLVYNKHPPKDPGLVARACFTASFIYFGFFLFCFCQSWLHSKEEE
jgi:ribonuclease kappa